MRITTPIADHLLIYEEFAYDSIKTRKAKANLPLNNQQFANNYFAIDNYLETSESICFALICILLNERLIYGKYIY